MNDVHTWPVRVYWEDTDAGGVVYYANYLKFLERARSEWLRDLGIGQGELIRLEGLIFVVRNIAAEFLRPARFDDLLMVRSRLLEMGGASLTLEQEVVREATILLTARVRIACVKSGDFRPARIPTHIIERLLR
ncbi:MAG: tol-pal system-associated acyl-CoA thioesterase [Thiobacillaceae bacterium]